MCIRDSGHRISRFIIGDLTRNSYPLKIESICRPAIRTLSSDLELPSDLNSASAISPSKFMRLLYFAPHQVFPVNTGARLRNYHLARQLGARCSVTFAEMRQAEDEWCGPPSDSGLAGVITLNKSRPYSPWKIVRGLVGPTPVTVL